MTIADRVRAALTSVVDDRLAPGAVVAVSVDGRAIDPVAVGHLASIHPSGRPLRPNERVPVSVDTRYDLASITKLYTAIAMLSLSDDGIVALDTPVADWLADYRAGPKAIITLRHLLTHVSGLPDVWEGWHGLVDREGAADARWVGGGRSDALNAILALPLLTEPGDVYRYSCMGYITAMAIAETATGTGWADVVRDRVLVPLGLSRTGFAPVAAEVAPTEYTPQNGRGLVSGTVHDETAFALGGVSGNAGLFAAAPDLLSFGEALLDGVPGVLGASAADALWRDQLPASLAEPPAWGQSIGLRIGQESWMTAGFPDARGHTGFTGPSLLVDRHSRVVVAVLTNRVHPSRELSDGNVIRGRVHRAVLEGL
jgi:CubicO group peptidase (beta-lactamase class C family)